MALPCDKALFEAMTNSEKPWEDMHHHSYFLPELSKVESGYFSITMPRYDD
jgi:hypothetical protein